MSSSRNASRTLKLCQNISIWDIENTIKHRHIFKFSGLIFSYLFLVSCSAQRMVVQIVFPLIAGQYKSTRKKLILVLRFFVPEYVSLRLDRN